MRREPEHAGALERALAEAPVPGEAEAEQRGWAVVRAAYAERSAERPTQARGRLALALAGGLVALLVGLSPAGARVGELVEDVIGIGAEDARPALRSLPTAGELLVESERGVWIVRADGSKRLLGEYSDAAFSPRGLFVAAADGHQLVVVDPLGSVRWTVAAPARVRDPRWSPSGYRIAYRSGDDLRVVAGDGTGDRLLARDVAAVAPAWRPLGARKLAPDGAGSHIVSYVDADERIRAADADSGEGVAGTPGDLEQLSAPPVGGTSQGAAVSPDGRHLARITYKDGRERLTVAADGESAAARSRAVLVSTRGKLTGPSWSPDGRWLLAGLPAADQWVFIRTGGQGRIVAFDGISGQFDPGGDGEGRFPRVAGWVLPQR